MPSYSTPVRLIVKYERFVMHLCNASLEDPASGFSSGAEAGLVSSQAVSDADTQVCVRFAKREAERRLVIRRSEAFLLDSSSSVRLLRREEIV